MRRSSGTQGKKLKSRMILGKLRHRYHEDHLNKHRDERGRVSFKHTDGPYYENKSAQYCDV